MGKMWQQMNCDRRLKMNKCEILQEVKCDKVEMWKTVKCDEGWNVTKGEMLKKSEMWPKIKYNKR